MPYGVATPVVVIMLFLPGCGLMAEHAQQKRVEELVRRSNVAIGRCNEQYLVANPQTAMARARCLAGALAIKRSVVRYPDLLDSIITARIAIAEQFKDGKITAAQGDLLLANKISEVASEEQHRDLANRSVRAQEAATEAATSPIICSKVGTLTVCN